MYQVKTNVKTVSDCNRLHQGFDTIFFLFCSSPRLDNSIAPWRCVLVLIIFFFWFIRSQRGKDTQKIEKEIAQSGYIY